MVDRRQAYHTPQQLSGTTIIRQIVVPVDLLPHVGGALNDLLNPNSWDAVGVSIEDTIKAVHDMIDLYYRPFMIGAIWAFIQTPDLLPPGWLHLEGSTIPDGEELYPELWEVLPESWKVGSDIQPPEMLKRSLVGAGGATLEGSTGGAETHTLTVSELPPHTHTYLPPTINPDVEGPGIPDVGATVLGSITNTGATGDGEAHNNMPPYLAVTWAIFAGR